LAAGFRVGEGFIGTANPLEAFGIALWGKLANEF
jgi:hypothetical protein